MTNNFTIADLIAIGEGFCVFSLFAFVPGYVLGWALNILRFRRRSLLARVALSTPLSIAFCPILSYLLGRCLSMTAVWVAYGLLWITFLRLLLPVGGNVRRLFAEAPKGWLVFPALIAGWVILGTASLVDIQIRDRLYFSLATFDQCVRTAFTNAISTSGIPPQNPFFLPGHPVSLRYHYFWLILCSLVDQLGGTAVGPRHAVIAGTLWCGIGLMSLIPLYLRFFDSRGALDLARRSLTGVALLGVTGLGVVPAALLLAAYHQGFLQVTPASVALGNDPIAGWVLTVLWQPHYVAALIACLTGFLIIWHAPEADRRHGCLLAGVAAGAAFATAVGTAIYIAFVFAVFLGVWTFITLARRWRQDTLVLAVAGLSALLLSLPYLRELSGPGASGPFLQLTVRSFYPAEIVLRALQLDQWWRLAMVNALFLPLNYFLELGFFFAIGYLQWRKYRQRGRSLARQDLAALCMVATSVAVCTFLRSGVIANNDLGWRGFLITQFVLLIWGANYLAKQGSSRGQRAFLTALLILGAIGTAYDVVMQRAFLMFSDAGIVSRTAWLASSREIGKRTYANRRAYEWLQRRTPASAVVQQNPDVVLQDTFYLAYGNRRTVAQDTGCGAGFGGDARLCEPVLTPLKDLFSAGADPERAEAVCRSMPIDVLVARDTDQVWNDKRSWVWSRKPAFANDFVRVLPCPWQGLTDARVRQSSRP